MPLVAAGLSTLACEQCLRLLRGGSIGRVVLSIHSLPAALPVNYKVIGDDIVFRTSRGAKLSAALNHTIVAFEVDEVNVADRSGWSVLVVGEARAVTEPAELALVEHADIQTWRADPTPHYVAIRIARVSGRALGPPATAPTLD